jgi:ribosomal protein S18 acetylase RimI-like enzyme
LKLTTTRQATPEDLAALYDLHKQALGPHVQETWGWDEAWQASCFRDRFDPTKIQVLQRGSLDIGALRFRYEEDATHLDYIALAAQHQRQGIGAAIVRGIMAEAEAAGLPVRLSVLKANPATKLYERLGLRTTHSDDHRHFME